MRNLSLHREPAKPKKLLALSTASKNTTSAAYRNEAAWVPAWNELRIGHMGLRMSRIEAIPRLGGFAHGSHGPHD